MVFTYENADFPPNTAGFTLYTKASVPVNCNIRGNAPFSVTTEWAKIDIPWAKFGADPAKPAIGWQFDIRLAQPADKDMWIIFDRLGTEGPQFIASPAIEPKAGPDQTVSTAAIAGNAETLAATIDKLKNKQPFKIVAFGDSITAGAQAYRGSWDLKDNTGLLYFGHLARLLNARYGYDGVTYVQKGYGGWTSQQALTVVEKDVVPVLNAGDLVILQFGPNDLSWAGVTVDQWLTNTALLIAAVRTKTDQVIIMSTTTFEGIQEKAAEVGAKLPAFARDQKMAYMDVTKWATFRGKPLSWGFTWPTRATPPSWAIS